MSSFLNSFYTWLYQAFLSNRYNLQTDLPPRFRVELEVMAIKRYSSILRSLELQFNVITRIQLFLVWGFFSCCKGYSQCILNPTDKARVKMSGSNNPYFVLKSVMTHTDSINTWFQESIFDSNITSLRLFWHLAVSVNKTTWQPRQQASAWSYLLESQWIRLEFKLDLLK